MLREEPNRFQFRMMPEIRGFIFPKRGGEIHYIGGAEILPAPPLDLLGFLCAVLKDACVCLHNSLRLDEDGRTGRRDVMDDTAHLTAILAFDRNDIPAISDGDDALLYALPAAKP